MVRKPDSGSQGLSLPGIPRVHVCRWHFLRDAMWHVLCVRLWEHDDPPRFLWPPSFVLSAFQRHNGEILTAASVKHLSHWRFVVSFQLDRVQRTDQDLYRCVTQSPRGSGVSNFAELVVKGNRRLFSLHFIAPHPLSFSPLYPPHHPAFFSPLIFITTRFSCLSSATLRNQMTVEDEIDRSMQ